MPTRPYALEFDLEKVPFSRRGSWLALNRLPGKRARELGKAPGLFLRTLHGGVDMPRREIFRIETLTPGGRVVPARDTATPSRLTLALTAPSRASKPRARPAPDGLVEAVFATPTRLLLRGRSAGLRLIADGGWYATLRPAGPDHWEVNLFGQRIQLMVTRRSGLLAIDAPWTKDSCDHIRFDLLPDPATGAWEIELEEFSTAWTPPAGPLDLDSTASAVEAEFAAWLATTPPAATASVAPARALAAYVLWTSLVAPAGHLRREAMFMSKNWMTNVWSWDHCFNALALAEGQPDLAWDQWALLFDFQHASGALPDCVNDATLVWNFAKPPVHGWALRELRRLGLRLSTARTRQAYGWLAAWTDWWLAQRDDDQDGLPQYNHGNDSGWDNATVLGDGPPVEGADLATFLVLQMDVLADLANELGKPRAATRWRERADRLTAALTAHSWRGDRFVCPRSGDHHVAPGDSLVPHLPILLGPRLLPAQRTALVRHLRRFVTPFGLATEHPASPLYEADGYWRGPVWAPSTLLVISGLRSCGEDKLANRIARHFCRACVQSGMAENFDALTGDGLRDRAYSWTAAVFLRLAAAG